MTDEHYLKLAKKQALKALKQDEVPIGCVIVHQDKILAQGHNQKEKSQNALKHAEIICINKALRKLKSKYLNDCTLYVTLEPCLMCAGAIINARVGKVVYGLSSDKPSISKCLTLGGINHKPILIDANDMECAEIIKSYFKEKRFK